MTTSDVDMQPFVAWVATVVAEKQDRERLDCLNWKMSHFACVAAAAAKPLLYFSANMNHHIVLKCYVLTFKLWLWRMSCWANNLAFFHHSPSRLEDYRVDHSYHGLRTPNEVFFHRNPKVLGLGRQIGQVNFGVFSVHLSKLIFWVPCLCFSLVNHYFYKN
jgi:hypothetical protein